ncbi:MAG: FAD-dependent oxidoreductase [Alphaproteobacteria bacterium]|nr:FAD-dependent oxidoreductase [Alphaproteobacteria bacterium]MBU1526812.1 FAD-dependent oxidoreductase [Alphaproteobacteria bacterium]MBU2351647.1 FAD-dependent oxidoreductase [Alphaproteobacteria bacterium]MBU2381316.1 FAD-dependent oxidoreductase [Alphaproteobacteria bacterium]
MTRVLIVGAGHAGGSAAAFLRQYGFAGEIVLAGTEPVAPYQRPPLSKAWLKGEAGEAELLLRPESFYAEQAIDLRLGATATAIDRAAKTVAFADGAVETYDHLILALGAEALRLEGPGWDDPRVLVLRDMADAEALKAALRPDRRLVVIGAGYVGLEAAASARALGAQAVVLEREGRALSRVASDVVGIFLAAYHHRRGVEVLPRAAVRGVQVHPATGEAVVTVDGAAPFPFDVCLVGVGARPVTALAEAAGLVCKDGILVDGDARTSDPAVFAIGDMTRRPVPILGLDAVRLESVPSALEQARQAAAAITGRPAPLAEVPWFWSDQYDLKIQIAGLPTGADARVVRGEVDPETTGGGFAVFHLRGDRLVCVEAVNAPAEFMGGRMLIQKGQAVDVAKLADPAVPMKAVAVA